MTNPRRVLVIGAGLSGLAAAYRLERAYPAPIWQSEELLLFRLNEATH